MTDNFATGDVSVVKTFYASNETQKNEIDAQADWERYVNTTW